MNNDLFNIDELDFTPINRGLGFHHEIEKKDHLVGVTLKPVIKPTAKKQFFKINPFSLINFLATIIDVSIVFIFFAIAVTPIVLFSPIPLSNFRTMYPFIITIFTLMTFIYFLILKGKTIGNIAAGISTCKKNNEQPTAFQILIRLTLNVISPLLLFLPWIFNLPSKLSNTYLIGKNT